MPPRRSTRVPAAVVQRAFAFPQLPLGFVLDVFSLLPADQRLRCGAVSRGWRATVALPALWRRVDLSPASGVAQPVSRTLLRSLYTTVAHAGATVAALDVSGVDVSSDDLVVAARAVAGALVEVRTSCELSLVVILA